MARSRSLRFLLASLAVLALVPTACATTNETATTTATTTTARGATSGVLRQPTVVPVVPRPRSPGEASALLGQAMVLLKRDAPAEALPRLQAVLHSDFLTDRGRADLYWLVAEAARDLDDAVYADALAGYLVAASLVPDDVELTRRTRDAQTALTLRRVQRFDVGATRQRAIVVDNEYQARRVLEALPCGADGGGHYVERRLPPSLQQDDPLTARRVLCTENGDERVLWFRIEE